MSCRSSDVPGIAPGVAVLHGRSCQSCCMRAFVFVDSWQMRCCGNPFSVGSTATWYIEEMVNEDWLTEMFGDRLGDDVGYHQSDHGMTGPASSMRTVVQSIRAVTHGLELDPNPPHGIPGRVYRHVASTGRLTSVTSADGRASDTSELTDTAFAGYIVEVEVLELESEEDET